MMLNDDNKKSAADILKSRALYVTLSVCVLAAGVVGVSAMKNTKDIRKMPAQTTAAETTEQTTAPVIITQPVTAPPVMPEITTVPVVNTTEEAQPVFDNDIKETAAAEQEKPPADFRTPLSVSIGKDYSMGIPVFSSTMADYRTHNGVDFLGAEGDDVASVGEGDVISVKKDAVWGNCVTVDHGDGVVSTLCGLADDDKLVAEGTHVYTGTVLGRVGEVPVEAAENSHIHLEVRYNDVLMDPLTLLGLDGNRNED